eukprot:TRINITY_DN2605_c0_g2_i1.p1 TRINITY_DN2605_c0_g2~~TRINITY_DN2605_c0_g2_i1.p1  ORF type:complete len:1113 (-),score=243.30 TRINITY_DN2605_c0_g2_i1:322-3537(-)
MLEVSFAMVSSALVLFANFRQEGVRRTATPVPEESMRKRQGNVGPSLFAPISRDADALAVSQSMSSILLRGCLVFLIFPVTTLIRFSPGLAEACIMVLVADIVRCVAARTRCQKTVPDKSSDLDSVPLPSSSSDLHQAQKPKKKARKAQKTPIPAQVSEPADIDSQERAASRRPSLEEDRSSRRKPSVDAFSSGEPSVEAAASTNSSKRPSLEVSAQQNDPGAEEKRSDLWGDVEEEDELQQRLAERIHAVQLEAACIHTKLIPPPAPEEADAPPPRESEPPRRKGGGKHSDKDGRPRKGKGDSEGYSNPWINKIRACGKNKDFEGVLALAESALAADMNPRRLQESHNAVLHALLQCGDVAGNAAQELFEKLKADKQADVVTFNIMLRALLSEGKREEAQVLLQDMSDHGLSANKVTICELLADRVKAEDAVGIWRIVDWMKSTDFGVTNAACSILVKRLQPGIADEEIEKTFELVASHNEPLDEPLCASAVEAAIRCDRPMHADSFMTLMGDLKSKSSMNSSASTYGSMIKLHGHNHDIKQVWATWNAMKQKGVSPSSVALGCMVEALVNSGETEAAAELVAGVAEEQRGSSTCILNTVIFSSIIKGFTQAKKPERCFEVLKQMDELGIQGNTITYNTVLDALAKSGLMAEVPAIFETMRQRQIEPDKITYSTLIKGYCVVGELDCALQLFEELKADERLEVDEIVYNSLIDGCGRLRKSQQALEFLDDMAKNNVKPSNYTMSIMVKLLGRSRRLPDALKLVTKYRDEHGLKPNLQVFTCLIQACLLNKKVAKAMSLYGEMISDLGALPDRKAHTILIDGLLAAGAFNEAVMVARCAYRLPVPDFMPMGRHKEVGLERTTLSEMAQKVRQGKVDDSTYDDLKEVANLAGITLPSGPGPKGSSDSKQNRGKGRKDEDFDGNAARKGSGGKGKTQKDDQPDHGIGKKGKDAGSKGKPDKGKSKGSAEHSHQAKGKGDKKIRKDDTWDEAGWTGWNEEKGWNASNKWDDGAWNDETGWDDAGWNDEGKRSDRKGNAAIGRETQRWEDDRKKEGKQSKTSDEGSRRWIKTTEK